jgi:hypothetical protein
MDKKKILIIGGIGLVGIAAYFMLKKKKCEKKLNGKCVSECPDGTKLVGTECTAYTPLPAPPPPESSGDYGDYYEYYGDYYGQVIASS